MFEIAGIGLLAGSFVLGCIGLISVIDNTAARMRGRALPRTGIYGLQRYRPTEDEILAGSSVEELERVSALESPHESY